MGNIYEFKVTCFIEMDIETESKVGVDTAGEVFEMKPRCESDQVQIEVYNRLEKLGIKIAGDFEIID